MGARELVGEPEIPLFERVWARPTLEVHGIRGGFIGEGAKTVIPARAVAKISTRLVADQTRRRSRRAIASGHAKPPVRSGVTAELKVLTLGAPSLTNPDNPFIHAAAEAMKRDLRQGNGLHPLRRLDSDCGRLRPVPGHPQRDDGLRSAGRQPARAQREVPPAELLPRHRSRGAVSGDSGGVAPGDNFDANLPPKGRPRLKAPCGDMPFASRNWNSPRERFSSSAPHHESPDFRSDGDGGPGRSQGVPA